MINLGRAYFDVNLFRGGTAELFRGRTVELFRGGAVQKQAFHQSVTVSMLSCSETRVFHSIKVELFSVEP